MSDLFKYKQNMEFFIKKGSIISWGKSILHWNKGISISDIQFMISDNCTNESHKKSGEINSPPVIYGGN